MIPVDCSTCGQHIGAILSSSYTPVICNSCLFVAVQWMDLEQVLDRNPLAIALLEAQGKEFYGPENHSGNIRIPKPKESYFVIPKDEGNLRFGFQAIRFPLTN